MSSERPTLAVLVTYYGERELLRECLDSLAGQTVAPDEILVFDDASDAPAIDYVPSGMRVEVIRVEENRGPGFGRNALLRMSRSQYVHFHDADDLFEPGWCAAVHDALAQTGVEVVFTEVRSFDAEGTQAERVLGLRRLTQDSDLVRFCLRGAMLTPSGTYLKQLLLDMGGYRADLAQSEDWEFHVRLAAKRPSFTIIDDPLVRQRLRPDSRHHQAIAVWTSCCRAIESLALELPAEYQPDLADAAARAGSVLFQLGARAEADAAYALVDALGGTRFDARRSGYRLLARALGPRRAEALSSRYRRMLPQRLRAYIAAHGW